MAIALLVFAAVDYAFERYEYKENMKMTKKEVKREYKETEGDPLLKARIRAKQREVMRRRMIAGVAKADVVVTNPTEIAVALQYQKEKMVAPTVIAKGRGYVALKIREVAEQHNVPIVENPPLARLLEKSTEIGAEIPEELYNAVAEVLAFVYANKGMEYQMI